MESPDGGLASLAEDLVLLATRPKGTIAEPSRLTYALRGPELVRLAAEGRAGIRTGRITVLDAAPTGDPNLDAALADLAGRGRGPLAREWIRYAPRELRDRYLQQMAAAGTLAEGGAGLFRKRVYPIADPARATADAVAATLAAARAAALAASLAATQASTEAATHAAAHAAVHAATHAAVHAATHAAVHAASQAAIQAGASGAADAGGGHHHH